VLREYVATSRYRAGRSCMASDRRTTPSVPLKHDVHMSINSSATDDAGRGLKGRVVLSVVDAAAMQTQVGETA
jgi:hypothetical protein